jgi:hypothetical protein
MSLDASNADLLVLESDWGEDLCDCRTSRPFLEGLANVLGITVVYRTFHSGRNLEHWLHQMFMTRSKPAVAYISSHGRGRFLHASLREAGIDFRRVVAAATKRTRQVHGRRGLLLGSCEIGRDLDGILDAARGRLDWVAGYEAEIPWVESMLIDLAFLSYLLSGREVFQPDGKGTGRRAQRTLRTSRSEKAASWVLHDFGVAQALRFRAKDWRTP